MRSFRTFTNHSSFLIEAKTGSLDMSVPNADKAFSNYEMFFEKNFEIEEKLDGTKLTLFRNDEDFDSKDFTKNWIVAYDNRIQNFSEFSSTPLKRTIKQGTGISQYKLIFEHLKKYHKEYKSIPKNTEFKVEFLMSKGSITRNYTNKHRLILIGYTHNAKIDQKRNEHYADVLKVDLPMPIFKGKLNSFENLKEGIEHSHLRTLINQKRDHLSTLYEKENWEELYREIKGMFLDIPSFYGGKMEGVIMKDTSANKTYKFLQDDQHDEETRNKKKNKSRMSREEENAYFNEIRMIADEILSDVGFEGSFSEVMKKAVSKINSYKFSKKLHAKKTDHQVREDIHLTLKLKYEKLKDGWAGIIGKFRIVTKEHVKMIEYALDKYKGVSVMIVSGQRDAKLIQENIKILEEIFKDKPVEFFTSATGNFVNLERKTKNPIAAYICGPDREKDYQKQLDNANNDAILDLYDGGKREDVSASKAEEALQRHDITTLKKILHPVAHKRLDSWSKFYV
jgi:hypothetical protein